MLGAVNRKRALIAIFCGLILASTLFTASAETHPPAENTSALPSPKASNSTQKSSKRYFVEFRSRSALSYGHTFLVHGKLNSAGKIGQVRTDQVAGLHPATESTVPWMIGHLIPVISETGASDGDTEEEYVTARYRVLLTEAEYANVSSFIVKHRKNSPLWHAVLYNCNAWIADVAKFMNLKSPSSTMLYPEEFINGMSKLNGAPPSQVLQVRSKPPASVNSRQKPRESATYSQGTARPETDKNP